MSLPVFRPSSPWQKEEIMPVGISEYCTQKKFRTAATSVIRRMAALRRPADVCRESPDGAHCRPRFVGSVGPCYHPVFRTFSSGRVAPTSRPHRPEAQDVALSRPKHGFESRWGRHKLDDEPVEQRIGRNGRIPPHAALGFLPQRHRANQPPQQQARDLRLGAEVGLPRPRHAARGRRGASRRRAVGRAGARSSTSRRAICC